MDRVTTENPISSIDGTCRYITKSKNYSIITNTEVYYFYQEGAETNDRIDLATILWKSPTK